MDLKCSYPDCNSTFHFSGRGRVPHYCIPHRVQINREKAAGWHRAHYKLCRDRLAASNLPIDPEATIRPLKSHLFLGPGLFESTETLFNHALFVKARSLNQPIDYVRTQWINGQAGREFLRSFMNPAHC